MDTRTNNTTVTVWPSRYTVIGLCFAGTLICYMDRVNISVAVIPMAEQYGWSRTTQGVVLSSFFWGYLATQVLGGWLADRYGGKVVLGAGVLLWSLFTLVTPPAAALGFAALFAVRVGMGMGEGVAFPSIYSLFARWVPAPERARAIALNASAIPMGTIAALLLTPLIVVRWGWPMAFYSYGALGIVWFAFWRARVTATPQEQRRITPAELEHIGSSAVASASTPSLPWRTLLARAPVWAIIVGHFCNNYGGYVILTWLPTYVNQALGGSSSRRSGCIRYCPTSCHS